MTRLLIMVITLWFFASCKESTPAEKTYTDDSDEWISLINKRIKSDTLNDALYFQRGQYFYEKGNYDLAIQDLIRAINIDSLQLPYYHLLSDASLDYYRSKEALLTMKRCVDLFPDSINSLLKYTETQYILKQYDEALVTCNKILMRDNQNAEAFFMIGMIFKAKGDLTKAVNAFQSSTELDPEIVDSWLMLGEIYEAQNNPLALEYYDAALNVAPDNISALHTKAFYLQNNNKVAEAIDLYRQIITVDRNYVDAYLNSGILYLKIDSLDRAMEQFNIMTKQDPTSALGFYYKGLTHDTKGESDLAKSNYRACLNLQPSFERAQEALARLE